MNNPIQTTKLIAVYARVSTSNQENEGTIETQLSAVKEYAHNKGYTIVKEYKDEGWSGSILARPALDKLRQDAENKLWEGVLIYDPSRLARKYSYQELILDELASRGVDVMFVTIPPVRNEGDQMLRGINGLFAEYERAKISERFRLGKIRKVKEGHLLVSEPLYGYSYIPKKEKKHGYYVINEEEAGVVKKIFSWVADDGLTIRGLVLKLQEENIKPRKSKRGVWNISTLTTMLRNEAYIGKAKWGSSYAVVPENPTNINKYRKIKKSSRRMKPKDEWIIIPVPKILDKKLFNRVQKQIKTNTSYSKRNKKYEYLLSGKITCSCGKKRLGEASQGGKHLYYRCSDRIYSFPIKPECEEKGINAKIADGLVWKKLSKLMTSSDLLNKQVKRWQNKKKDEIKSDFVNTDVLKKEIDKLKKQEDRYNRAYGSGAFSVEQLREYTVPIRERVGKLEKEISEAIQKERELSVSDMPKQNEVEEFAKKVKKHINDLSFSSKREIVLSAVEKIIGTQEKLCVSGYIPINNYVSYKTSDRNCGVAECWKINAF